MLATINRQAFRAHEMIADLMLFARPPRPEKRAIDAVRLVDTLIGELSALAREQRTELVRLGNGQSAHVMADENHLAEALRAVLINALEALGMGGKVEVEIQTPIGGPHQADHQMLKIVIRDNGPGMDPREREHLFDPFFSGREAGRGLGFGLSKAWRIITLHQGQIEVQSQPGHGATFIIALPSAAGV
jgi:signal transduction histidine kinase